MEHSNNEKYFVFLDSLRETGATNMFGAVPFMLEMFNELGKRQATAILTDWMKSFDDRHPEGETTADK